MSGMHARLSASAAHRWLRCAGSLGPSTSSEYAAAGTYAHEIAAAVLEEPNRNVSDWLGVSKLVDGFTVTCDQEMVDAVQLYRDTLAEDFQPGDLSWVEMPLLKALQQVDPEMGGTADFVRYRPSTMHLRVFDFKFGSGTYVEVEDNEQMKVYSLGAMVETNQIIRDVTMTIVQPRFEGAEPVRDFHFEAVDILDFIGRIREAAARTRQPNPVLVSGSHCKPFCPNRRTCPELEKAQHAIIAAEFTSLIPYDVAKLAVALEQIPLVKARMHAIEEFAYSEAVRGVAIPGYKLVDKRPTRRWVDVKAVDDWAKQNAIDAYGEPELLSPAQLEKKVPKAKRKELEPLFAKVSSGQALVPVSDDRPPAVRIQAADFVALPAEV